MREILNITEREGKIDKRVNLIFERANRIRRIRRNRKIKNLLKRLRRSF